MKKGKKEAGCTDDDDDVGLQLANVARKQTGPSSTTKRWEIRFQFIRKRENFREEGENCPICQMHFLVRFLDPCPAGKKSRTKEGDRRKVTNNDFSSPSSSASPPLVPLPSFPEFYSSWAKDLGAYGSYTRVISSAIFFSSSFLPLQVLVLPYTLKPRQAGITASMDSYTASEKRKSWMSGEIGIGHSSSPRRV